MKIVKPDYNTYMPFKKGNVNRKSILAIAPAFLFYLGLSLLGGSFSFFQKTLQPFTTPETLFIRTTSLLAISVLHFVLLIAPLSKIHSAFLALLPLRKPAEILLLIFASLHGFFSLMHFHAGGNRTVLASLFLSNTQYGSFAEFPFQTLGFIGLLLLLTFGGLRVFVSVKRMAAWNKKLLHYLIQIIYVLVLLHVALGILQYDAHPFYWTGLVGGAILVLGCFVLAYFLPKPISSKKVISQWIIRIGIAGAFFSFPFLSYGIVYWQKPFTTHVYEKEYERTFEGFYFDYPVPLIQLDLGYYDPSLDSEALLVGPKKMGAQKMVKNAVDQWGNLNGKKVRIKGKLLYGDRKQLIELSETKLPIEVILNSSYPITQTRPKNTVLQGEIISSKSWFGFMNPAEGKAHKSTAIRSIESGIPPLLRIQKDGRNNYYILQNNQDINFTHFLSGFVAQQVEITGETFYQNGWNVLTFTKENIRLLK